MRVQFEKTDTFGGEANYSWVRRETLVLPDGTDDRVVIGLARQWAGWNGKNSRCEKMGGNDDLKIVPKGRAEVVFVTFDYDQPQGITPDDVVRWATDIRAAARTEDKARITEREAVLADAIYLAQSTIGTPGEPLGCPTGFTPTPFCMTQEQYDADPTQGIDGQGA